MSLIPAIRLINRNNLEAIQKRLREADKSVTGATLSAVNSKIVLDKNSVTGEIYAPHNAKYTGSQYNFVESGRKKGSKMSPPGALVPWMQARRIPLKYEFAVAKVIAEKGVKPVAITEPAIKSVMNINLAIGAKAMTEEVRKPIAELVDEQLRAALTGIITVT